MPETTPPAPPSPRGADVLTRAHRTRVVVVGGGVAGLVAALEWAKVGARVTVLEAADRFGGSIETVELGGIPVDLVADAFPREAPALAALIDELRLSDLVESAAEHPVWIAGLPEKAPRTPGAAPLPAQTVRGIPANAWAEDVRRIIGWRGAWRAYLDRLRPPLTIGHQRSLGDLVRTRMGALVVDRLVAPVTRGLYGLDPDEVDVEIAAPGLSSALTRTGSLAGAVSELLLDPGDAPARATLRGGMDVLVAALVARLTDLDADLRTGADAVALHAVSPQEASPHEAPSLGGAPHGAAPRTWRVELAPRHPAGSGEGSGETAGEPVREAAGNTSRGTTAQALGHTTAPGIADSPDETSDASSVDADLVILATGARASAAVLSSAGVEVDAAVASAAQSRDVVTLVVDSSALDAAPRGRAVYPIAAPETSPASAPETAPEAAPGSAPDPAAGSAPSARTAVLSVSHATAEWPWLAAAARSAAGAGTHIVRVALPAQPGRSDEQTIALARAGAATLLGVPLGEPRAAARRTVELAPPASAWGHAQHTADVRGALPPAVTVVGGWVAGSGLAQIVADATDEVDRSRRAVLWGTGVGIGEDSRGGADALAGL